MKTILLASLMILPVAAMAAPSAAQLAAQPANQSTTFSTGSPVHSPWVVLQQATLSASAGWNTNSTTTVVPSTAPLSLRIVNQNSNPVYVVILTNSQTGLQFSQNNYMCEIKPNSTVNNYFSDATCTQILPNANSYIPGVSTSAYIYISDSDLNGQPYSNSYYNCTPTGSGVDPVASPGDPFQAASLQASITLTVTGARINGCSIG